MRWKQLWPTITRVLKDPESSEEDRTLAISYRQKLIKMALLWHDLKRIAYNKAGYMTNPMVGAFIETMKSKMREIVNRMMEDVSMKLAKYMTEEDAENE